MPRTTNPNIEQANLSDLVAWLSTQLKVDLEEFNTLLGIDATPGTFEEHVYVDHIIQVKGRRTLIEWGSTQEPAIRQAMLQWFSHAFTDPRTREMKD